MRSLTSWPSVGPVTSSLTTVKVGTPGGIRGWSQQTFTGAGLSVLHATVNVETERARAATVPALAQSGELVLLVRIGYLLRGAGGDREPTPAGTPRKRKGWS